MKMIRRCSWLIMLMMLVGCTGTQTSSPESDLPAVGDRPASEENETSTAGEQTAVPQEEWIMDVPDLTSLDSITLIVNKQHGLPEDYEPQDLVTPEVTLAKSSITLRAQAAEAIRVMFDAAAEEGISLMIGSGYRSYEYQKNLYNNYVERDGERQASRYSAKPGMSEHQTGLAVDLSGSNGECYLKECFKETEEGLWLKDNAWKYGRSGGRVWVTLRSAPEEVRLTVRDEGPGIPKEQQDRIWQRFYQVDPARGQDRGAGLGLSIVRQIARLHGGTVTLESAPGAGSAFTLHLPAAEGLPEPGKKF